MITKKLSTIILLALTSYISNLHADATDYDPYFPSQTSAMVFVKQAALLGGAAYACGADVNDYVSRVNQVLYRMSISSGDKVLASAHFQRAFVQAQTMQVYSPAVSCQKVIEDFHAIPLMQNDYQQAVLPQTNPSYGQSPDLPPSPGPPYQSPVTATVGNNPPPNIIYLAPAGLPPPPNTPVDYNAPNIIHVAPSVGDFVDTTKPMPNINDIPTNPWTGEEPPVRVLNPHAGSLTDQ